MSDALRDIVRRYLEAHADNAGIVQTPIAGLTTIRTASPSGLVHAIQRPIVCLVLQGTKQVTMGARSFTFGAGDSLLISADVPIASQVMRASPAEPYMSLVVDLDLAIIAELSVEIGKGPVAESVPVRVYPTDAEVADAALRLMRLLDRPASVPVLHGAMVRELHYWLLSSSHGAAIRRLGWPDSHASRVARAVALLRSDYVQPLPVERLAAVAGMSPSSFHQHFRTVTSLSPLQFQKQLRLIEARRRMLADGVTVSSAAFAVGYESVSQFTREYRRMFGLPPARETEAVRNKAGGDGRNKAGGGGNLVAA